jgi:hypothetical protein
MGMIPITKMEARMKITMKMVTWVKMRMAIIISLQGV